jgi:hypothetical protein
LQRRVNALTVRYRKEPDLGGRRPSSRLTTGVRYDGNQSAETGGKSTARFQVTPPQMAGYVASVACKNAARARLAISSTAPASGTPPSANIATWSTGP